MFENLVIPKELYPTDPRFGCGPSLVPVAHLETMAKTGVSLIGTSHRQMPVRNLVHEIIENFKTYFHIPAGYEVVLGNGGATLLFDMIAAGIVKKSAVHFTCGEFSEKWYKSTKMYPGLTAKQVGVAYGETVEPSDDPSVDMIATTLNETSTGVQINTLPLVPASEERIVAVDATSGAGQVPCDLSRSDLFFFSPQKVFASEGGLWIAIMSPKAVERALKMAEDKTRYIPPIFSWKHAIENSRKDQTYNTPALCTLYLLNEQLKEMNKLGQAAVVEMAKRKANLLYGWAEKQSYTSPYIKNAAQRSTAVATIDLDSKIVVEDLLKALVKQKIVYNIDGYRALGRNQIRVSLFHNVSYENLEKLTKIIDIAAQSVLK